MIRKIIHIDQEKCNGCGACAEACHEGAIQMVDGKAQLIRDDYCDGLGDCLPACPTGAITFTEREAAAYDHAAVQEHLAKRQKMSKEQPHAGGCPGQMARKIEHRRKAQGPGSPTGRHGHPGCATHHGHLGHPGLTHAQEASQLSQWPVQIKLAPVNAPYFDKADLLIAADCTAFAYASFHQDFIRGRVTLIGCPKLDAVDYTEKLTEILKQNDIKSLTIVRMEVPCCGGLESAVRKSIQDCGKCIPCQVTTISIGGKIL